ncbi:hypothetical protein L7F22_043743 [Adiantum nelumboides]|nr:hypothetical protein [Adiantum nelumboides]
MAANNKLAFLSQAPPPGYVAGLGRGATGFTTRSDIGPAREGPSGGQFGKDERDQDTKEDEGDDEDDDDGRNEDAPDDQDPDNETGLFAGAVYERDDAEADRIWAGVDAQMDERRRKKREQREREEMEKLRQEKPKIQTQFADLKRGLSSVTEDEWANLPEAGNLTGKRRKAAMKRESRDTRSFAIPDSILIGNRDRNAVNSAIDAQDGGSSTVPGGATTSLIDIGEARNKIFSHRLDEAGDGTASVLAGSASTIDPSGYLTELSSTVKKTAAEIGDIKKARSLLDSVIKTNPKHAPGWIAAARLEEVAGKMAIARKVIAQGCENCPRSEDVWLENARLNTRDNAKVILAQAVQHLSNSVKIWMKAAELETDTNSKKRVLRKSLEYIPKSVKLWKELVNLEESPEDAKVLLGGAVASIPQSVELWLAFARLSEPKEAQAIINQARAAIPTSHEIWIAALRLLEQEGDVKEVQEDDADDTLQKKMDNIMVQAIKRLTKNGAVLSREQWLKEAEQVDSEGSPRSSASIVKATIAMDIDEEDRQTVWVEDAQACIERGRIATARAILAYTLRHFTEQASIWKIAADLEKQHGSKATLQRLLEKAVSSCPKSEELWLFYAKERWQMDQSIEGAREVLARAFDKNVGSESISLEAAQMEYQHGDKKAAGMLLQRARVEVGSARVWLKSALYERDEGNLEASIILIREAIVKYPTYWKFHLMLGQLLEHTLEKDKGANIRAAREAYSNGFRRCPNAVPLWLAASRLEEKADMSIRARAILEKARLSNPKSDILWNEAANVEERSGSIAQAKMLLSRGLQECPTSGLLNAHSIWLESKPSRKTKAADALKRTNDDARVLNLIARLFWNEGKVEVSRKWFDRCSQSDPDWGDGWAWWLKFERTYGSEQNQNVVIERCKRAQPKHGEIWQKIAKDWQHPRKTIEGILESVSAELRIVS